MLTRRFTLCFFLLAKAAHGQDAGTASFNPGTYGEPITAQVIVQNCSAPDDGNYCLFYGDGGRWAAARGQNSNEIALEVVAQAPVNTPFLITGDIVSFGDITAEVAISKIEPGTPDLWAPTRDAMQGVWTSTEDPQSTLSIWGSEQVSAYGGETVDVSTMTFSQSCLDETPLERGFFTQTMGGDPLDSFCYEVLNVTPDRLDLSYVGRGNTLSFTRTR